MLVATTASHRVSGFVSLLREAGAEVNMLRTPLDISPLLGFPLARVLRGERHDGVHCHLVHADWHAGRVGLLGHRLALVSTKHNYAPLRTGRVFSILEPTWIRRSQATIAISRSLAGFVECWSVVRRVVVPYGLAPGPPPPPVRAAVPDAALAVGRLGTTIW